MENKKDYSIKIDKSGNVSFYFDQACGEYYGSPISATSSTSMEFVPGNSQNPATLIKTTTIKETYRLRDREIRKEDINFALSLIELQHSLLTLGFLYPEDMLVPGMVAKMTVCKIKDEELYKISLIFEYDQYYEGEIQSKKIKEKAAFVMNKEKVTQIYEKFAQNRKIKESINLLQTLKELFKDSLILKECESVRPERANINIEKGIEVNDDDGIR